MRSTIFALVLVTSVSVVGCKTKKGASASSTSATTTTNPTEMQTGTTSTSTSGNTAIAEGANVGRVSHKYRDGGCATVIIIPNAETGDIVLIPKDKLEKDVDTDGQLIKFDYRGLKMKQPDGCNVGIPAEITNITKLK